MIIFNWLFSCLIVATTSLMASQQYKVLTANDKQDDFATETSSFACKHPLPLEIWYNIISYLPRTDRKHLSRTSTTLNDLVTKFELANRVTKIHSLKHPNGVAERKFFKNYSDLVRHLQVAFKLSAEAIELLPALHLKSLRIAPKCSIPNIQSLLNRIGTNSLIEINLSGNFLSIELLERISSISTLKRGYFAQSQITRIPRSF